MSESVQIRPLGHGEVEALVQLSLLAWAPVFASFRRVSRPEVYALLYPNWERQQREVVEQACRDGGPGSVWVAEVDGVVAGYIACTLNRETRAGAVELLAVHPGYQNRGIGTRLNAFALEQMRASGMRLAELMTGGDPGHAPARRCYEKAGYTALPLVRYYQAL
jgi:ribosomal protein S18 acetylase RimI-like enzyme